MGHDRLDRHAAGHLARVSASHSIADDIESKGTVRDKTVLVMRPLPSDVGFRKVETNLCHGTFLLCRERMQARPQVLR
jgi:hypothetical protein